MQEMRRNGLQSDVQPQIVYRAIVNSRKASGQDETRNRGLHCICLRDCVQYVRSDGQNLNSGRFAGAVRVVCSGRAIQGGRLMANGNGSGNGNGNGRKNGGNGHKDSQGVIRRALTTKKRTEFLDSFRNCGIIRVAAESAGIHRQSHYDWLKQDSHYREDFATATPSRRWSLKPSRGLQSALCGLFSTRGRQSPFPAKRTIQSHYRIRRSRATSVSSICKRPRATFC